MMMSSMPMFLLDDLFDHPGANTYGCPPEFCRPNARASARSSTGPRAEAPKPQAKAPMMAPAKVLTPQAAEIFNHANKKEIKDAYLIWADLPGVAREDISITIKDDVLQIAGQQKDRAGAVANASPAVQAVLSARPRKAVDIKIPLKSDSNLDGIHAKLANGELTVVIPKKSRQHFMIPVLGPNEQPSATQPLAQHAKPAKAEPSSKMDAPFPDVVTTLKEFKAKADEAQAESSPAGSSAAGSSVAAEASSKMDVPYPDVVATLKEYKARADEAQADSSAASDSAAPAAEAPTAAPAKAESVASQEPESDGSWEDVSDEERKAERSARRRRSLPASGPVLDAITADAEQEEAATKVIVT